MATLSTVALHFSQARAKEVLPGLAAGAQGRIDDAALGDLVRQAGFADGATMAFLVGSMMLVFASVIVWLFLNVRHDELATDGPT